MKRLQSVLNIENMHDFLPSPVVFKEAGCVHAPAQWTPLMVVLCRLKDDEIEVGLIHRLKKVG